MLFVQTGARKAAIESGKFQGVLQYNNNNNNNDDDDNDYNNREDNKYMLFAGWEVHMMKNCDRGLENAAAFSRPRSQFFTIRNDPQPVDNIFMFFKLDEIYSERTRMIQGCKYGKIFHKLNSF